MIRSDIRGWSETDAGKNFKANSVSSSGIAYPERAEMMFKHVQNMASQFLSWIKKLFQSDITHKEIVCLANSRKYFGFCVAGKEISTGQWIRPVSREENGQLSKKQIRCQDDLIPQPLDVISVSLRKQAAHPYQKENYMVAEHKKWIKNKILSVSKLSSLCDNVACLWINGYSSYNGLNDRIPLKMAEENLSSSLFLIKPERLFIKVEANYNSQKKVRAKFFYKGIMYKLVITDPIIENRYLSEDIGEYPIENRELFLCVSLGEPYNGYCYKLVASVICL